MHQGLYRSRTDRVFGGVAAGIARSLNADTALIRLVFAILIIFGGGGLLLYLILWIAIPEEPLQFYQGSGEPGNNDPANEQEKTESAPYTPPVYPARSNNGALIAGLVLITIGALFLIDRLLPYINFHFRDFWPVIIVVAGIVLIYSSFTGTKKS